MNEVKATPINQLGSLHAPSKGEEEVTVNETRIHRCAQTGFLSVLNVLMWREKSTDIENEGTEVRFRVSIIQKGVQAENKTCILS